VCVFLAFGSSTFAQHFDFGFDFGVKGGVPFTDVLRSAGVINGLTTLTKTDDYLIGPVAELRIPFEFAIEVDGIYRGTQYHLITNDVPTNISGNAWEIPYLAKFRFPIPLLKPFVSAGGVYRSFTDLPTDIVTPTHSGAVLGGGLELRISKLRLSGELRWLHWSSPPNNTNPLRLGQNQGEVLFALVL
jgi:hypothetical protein